MNIKTKQLTSIALMTALTAVLAQISFPLPFTPVPISLATLGGCLAAGLLSWKAAAASQLIYLLLGAVGVPVFAGFTATAKLAGPTGGYLVGYIALALTAGLILQKSSRKFYCYPAAMVVGTAACYLLGTVWFMLLTGNGLAVSLSSCVLPFLPGDALKITAASLLCWKLQPILRRTIS